VAQRQPKDGRERCTATSKTTGQRCGKYPKKHFTVCRNHGAASPNAQAKAAERLAEEQARAALDRMNIVPVDDPLTELSLLAGQVLAWKDLIADKVHELNSYRYEGEHAEQLRGEVVLFERAMDRCISVLNVIAKLNIDERLAAITERQAKQLEDALFAAFDAAGLTINDTDQKEAVARHFGRQLTVLRDPAPAAA
jgi:hypothetical protein